MSETDWNRLRDLFDRVRGLDPPELAEVLDEACVGEPELRRELEALLAADTADGRLEIEDTLLAPEETRSEGHVPGAVIGGRYRIVARAGKGGMGEVYRADDLKLGQPVALKFLPPELKDDAERLDMLLAEVRVARRVAHPNVCRVYDVGEAEGRHFLTMEYIDGEDLSTLLRRIGRLPSGKAVQLARQICAGLAAAHEQGVVHRDLKPANVMIDGRGHARIADFGLALEGEVIEGHQARHGTPAYMAPEQLAGREATKQSDVYALGLVLYELFTGRQPFETRSYAEALEERSSGPPSRPSSHVEHFDQSVERAILRCLEPQPEDRPASALAVAAALPGGDPIAASLAAGETPSPELVAAAPTEGTVSAGLAVGAVVFCLVGVLAGLVLEFGQVLGISGRPPIVLADRAREILGELGYSETPGTQAWGYVRDRRVVDRMRDRPGEIASMLEGGAPPLYTFWYRASSMSLWPEGRFRVTPTDPPRATPGSSLVTLDTDGRLVGLEVVPRRDSGADPAGASPPRWETLLALAGLDPAAVQEVAPHWLPPNYAEERASWEGRYPAGLELRAEAAATAGKVSWFQIYSPDLGEPRLRSRPLSPLFGTLLLVFLALIVVAGLWLARANLRSGRGDRRGALRVGVLVGVVIVLDWVAIGTHVLALELLRLFQVVSSALLLGVLTALFYVGLEPDLRRRWPHRIVSWARSLDGRLRDPLVGRDLLVGATGATLGTLLPALWWELVTSLGAEQPALFGQEFEAAAWGVAGVVSVWLRVVISGAIFGLAFTVLLLAMTRFLRKEWLAATLFCAVLTFGACLREGAVTEPLHIVALALPFLILAIIMLRFGLLATVVLMGLAHLGILYPVTGFSGPWWAGGRMTLLSTIVIVAAYGAWCCARRLAVRAE